MLITLVLLSTCLTFTPGAGELRYLDAVEAQAEGRYADAYDLYGSIREDTPHLRGFALLEMAACQAAMGNRDGAARLYQALIDNSEAAPWVMKAQVRLAKMKKAERDYLAAAPYYRSSVLEVQPQPWWMYTYAWDAVDNLLRHPETRHEGYDWYQHRVETVGFIRPRLDAARELIKSPWPEHQAAALLGMIRSNAIRDVKNFFEEQGLEILLRDSQIPLVDLQQLILQISQQQDSSPSELATQIDLDTENPWLIVWLLHFAHQRLEAEDFDQAEAIADLVATRYPEQRDAGDLYWQVGQALKNNAQQGAAEAILLRLVEQTPSHFRVPTVLFDLGMHYLELDQISRAEHFFQRLMETRPYNRFQGEAYYKLAMRMQAMGDEAAALRHLKTASEGELADYYAHRALARLHAHDPIQYPLLRNLRIDPAQTVLLPRPKIGQTERPFTEAMEQRSDVRRLRFFGYYGLDHGKWEAAFLCRQLENYHDPGPWYQLIAEAGFAHTALEFATAHDWGHEDGRPTPERLRLEFPRAYWNKMLIIADEVGLDPYLFLSIAKQESTFRASVRSHAGATGVMQLMPATANWMIDVEPAITASHVANLNSPRNSIRLGGYYLRRMVGRSNGNLIDALAAYNAGPGNLDRWRSRFVGYELDAFVEAIPFTETRNYVKKVLGNYAAYHSLYPEVEPRRELARINAAEAEFMPGG